MSTSTPALDVYSPDSLKGSRPAKSASDPKHAGWKPPGWLREPLLHFVLLGGLIFAVDHVLLGNADDPNTIVISATVSDEAVASFEIARGRKPNAQELDALHRVWLDNEVLYREGLALGVDKGDTAIRERVIFKALSVVDSNVKLPVPDDKVLRAWFEAHRDKYDEPACFDFEEAALSDNGSEAAVREFVAALNAGTPGDAKAGLRVFKARPRPNLLDSYGPELTAALESAPVGTWQALETRDGWRAIKLGAMTPPKQATFEALRGPILHDWKDAVAAEQRTAAVQALTKKYVVKHEEPAKNAAR